MHLYLVHCGFYDPDLIDGTYESHVNFFVIAEDFAQAKEKAKANPTFKEKRMHVDGLQRIEAVDGFRIVPMADKALGGKTTLVSNRKKDISSQDFSE